MIGDTFNYESDKKTQLHKAGDHSVFFIQNAEKMLDMVTDKGETIKLDNATYGDEGTNGIYQSTLEVIQPEARGDRSKLTYDGRIKFDPDTNVDSATFFEKLNEEMSVGFGLSPFYFSNSRLVTSKHLNEFAEVSFYSKGSVTYSNNETSRSRGTHVDITLNAPTLGEVRQLQGGVEGQLREHIRAYTFTLNALSMAIAQKRINTIFIMTPEGPYYANREQRQNTRELHLGKQIAVTEKKSNENVSAETPKVMLEDIGGLEQVREELKKVAYSFKHAEIMKKWGASRPQGVLLYGPPGTGKTSLATALANEIEGELWEIKVTDIYDKWLGNSEKNITKIFAEAKAKTKPTVMFLDEFDALVQSENDGSSSRTAANVVGIFKREMNALREHNENIIVVAATNHEDRIDESLVRAGRFDIKCYVELPNEAARTQIFANKIADAIHTLAHKGFDPFDINIDMAKLGKLTDGMSGADISEVIRRISFKKAMEEASRGSATPITQSELAAIIQDIRTQ